MDYPAFMDWLTNAKPGTGCCYHRGFLMFDREPQRHPRRHKLNQVADTAWDAAQKGWVELFQRRNGDMDYYYFAVRR